METFITRIILNKEAFEKTRNVTLCKSMEDAFNHELARFSKAEKKYSGFYKLTNENGDISYFDEYKGIIPASIEPPVVGIYGAGPKELDLRKVTLYEEDTIVEEYYDFDNETAKVIVSKINHESLDAANQGKSGLTRINNFRLVKSLTLGEPWYQSLLDFQGGLRLRKETIGDIDTIICDDWKGNNICSQNATKNSFYSDCINLFDYKEMVLGDEGKTYKRIMKDRK